MPVEQYVGNVADREFRGLNDARPPSLKQAFQGLVIRDALLSEVGPAVCSGRSIFLHGPPGNGKTVVAKGLGRFLNQFGGDIYVPYALLVENSIVTVFDPVLHQTTDDPELPRKSIPAQRGVVDAAVAPALEQHIDRRWRRIRRPVVITGGELKLDMLELRYNPSRQLLPGAPAHQGERRRVSDRRLRPSAGAVPQGVAQPLDSAPRRAHDYLTLSRARSSRSRSSS